VIEKPTKEEKEYWEQVLHDHRLGMGRGKSSKVDYFGGTQELDLTEKEIVSKKTGRVKPPGMAPE
jgi:hypothetical protein